MILQLMLQLEFYHLLTPDYETQQTYTARVSVGDGTSIEWDGNSRLMAVM